MRRGMSRKDTLREVRLERGSLEIAKEVVSAAGWESILETLWQDLHFAVRQWTKNPGLALTAVLILAMGMAVSVPIFGFVDAALSRVIVHSVRLGPTQPKFLVL